MNERGYVGPKRGLQDEAEHWRELQAAARRAGAWPPDDGRPLRTLRELAANLLYAIAVLCSVIVVLGLGFLS